MVEFGARLSLKDNMYATLQKNLKMQKQFTEQVKRTSTNIKALTKAKIAPVIKAKDMATAVINKVKNGLKMVGKGTAKVAVALKDGATAGLNKIKDLTKALAKGVTIAVGIAGAGASLIMGGAISEGASLEQSRGGIETLFKGDAGTVKANADMAFKTAGLSANAYMEQVTSFSASLLQSLGGDTAKSAQVADMAIIDMADNANKMGTSMDMIQNAYQGFAKGNYTMLDNLKLGYGGTQEEMQRLLDDAGKLSGVEYDMSNLSDVYNAIHVVQEKMGITGTTAKEASQTFSGSFSSMKGAFSNLLGNMATGGDIEGSMKQLVESASTFLFNNAIPMIGRIIKALPKAIKTGIKTVLPQIKGAGADIIKGLKEGIVEFLPSSMSGIVPMISGIFNTIVPVISSAVAVIKPIMQSLGTHFQTLLPVIMGIIQNFAGIIQTVFPIVKDVISKVIEAVMPKVQAIAELIQRAIPTIGTIITGVLNGISTVFPVVWGIISPIIDLAISVIGTILDVVDAVFPAVQATIESVWGFLEPIFEAISEGIGNVADAIGGVADFVGDGVSTIAGWFGFAYGKDRVPYDNYPAMLHQGERVLTRNQADQYDRVMSTRGVKVNSPSVAPVSSNAGSSGTTVNIEKLADTVIIEKEADVDKVVESMVTKFRKLVPNMA